MYEGTYRKDFSNTIFKNILTSTSVFLTVDCELLYQLVLPNAGAMLSHYSHF